MTEHKNILVKNIYYMLSYAFQVLNQSNFKDIETEEFDDAQNLFAAILSKAISQQLKQGLYREYTVHNEGLQTVRGKVDLNGTIRSKITHRQTIACEFDELSEDNVFNRIIKTTAMFLLRSTQVESQYKDILKKEMMYFSKVGTETPSLIEWGVLRFHRNNQTYRMLMNLCQLVLDSMLLTTEGGENRMPNFLIDEKYMNKLYEKFVLEYYKKEYPQLNASAPYIDWQTDTNDMLPIMKSDVTLSMGDTVLILDTKFYSHSTQSQYNDSHTIHSHNLYQIFTYVKNKDAEFGDAPHKVSGMLLYARTQDELQPDNSYNMSGNRIDVKTLDLNREFSEIKSQLNAIAADFFNTTI